MVATTTTGMFLLCFDALCPCFGSKRKDGSEDPVLARGATSSSSFELRSISDRISGSPLRVPPSPSRFSLSSPPSRNDPLNLSLEQVIKLTRNFSPALMIGESYFGKAYRVDLQDGLVVAIKRARKEHFASLHAEFRNEIALLKKIEHRNLVQLLGYIDKGNERIVITEFVANGTLRDHLDGQHGLVLGFGQRLEIAIDVAHGLTYLHLYAGKQRYSNLNIPSGNLHISCLKLSCTVMLLEKPIIHRDVKSSNILLTEGFRAKVADFGFARIGSTEPGQSVIQTDVKGTAGYVDPEYLRTNYLTVKSDVFSYGILLLEILSGRRPIEVNRGAREKITVRWAFEKYNKGDVQSILDPMLTESVNEDILNKTFDVMFQCVAPTRADRPPMKEVVEKLWKIRRDYAKTQNRAEVAL
ncbi:calmodulin-binding receptor-like cytoplasmic kinase 3 isoform X1 [Brachypodium distachyon]|uniref:calmodulin-binding receptor-like cytoplasmic kinase 3 isoform X1 n=1 Tax=Brachypodium distachyon TaxID=15368 RepID=UPI00071D7048|nr:calmodulin-binding receptor-like cytoplasmic kinase 3 isoform X1 [Brachypodium distachyon]|eukprot:XP_014751300.1 calmodulin-binding receptor-like cytoplasmic kinase 3 isoform X1 [Brachypodium distachyon]